MEFNPVKSKLNLIYTGSLLFILIIFITVLYIFISGAIKKQEIEQLNRFYEEEKHEFVEEITKRTMKHIRSDMKMIMNMNMWNINRKGICSTMYLITALIW